MIRLVLGFVKGAVIGAAVGFGAERAGLGGLFHWLTYGVIGALVGLLCGRPFWSHVRDQASTTWTVVLKTVVGVGVGVGLYALVRKLAGGLELSMLGETRPLAHWPLVVGGLIGALYGAFVEVDDAPGAAPSTDAPAARR
jgi:hypothetical protein